jgi:hypothetical protein
LPYLSRFVLLMSRVCPEKERAAMQRRLSEVRPATLADQLSGLAKLHDSALKERWRAL